MDYLNRIYKKEDIENLITSSAEESINLEFKQAASLSLSDESKKREIAKDVSAMANSDGGLLIYGIEEKNHKACNTSFIDGNLITKEWLEQIINSRISRKIEGLIIDPIRFDENIQQTVYVVKIPSSINAPHMANDKKFYRRYNFQSVAMEEYEVRNLYNQKGKTSLIIKDPTINGSANIQSGNKIAQYIAKIEFNIENIGETIEELYKIEIKIPKVVAIPSGSNGGPLFEFLSRHENLYSIFSVPNSSPLFQNEYLTISSVSLKITPQNFQSIIDIPIGIKLYYSNGIETYDFNLSQYLQHNGKALNQADFQ